MQSCQTTASVSPNPVGVIGIALIGIGVIAAWYLSGAISQDPLYHRFADQRILLSLRHAHNVLSNLPFLIIGLTGIYLVNTRRNQLRGQACMYQVFFGAVFFTAFGSSYYHLEPDNLTLVWDRLPMAIGFMSILAAITAERIDAKLARLLLPWLLLAGVGSVLYWHWLDDLRPYAMVQFGSLLALLAILLRYRNPGSKLLWLALAFYALAKVFEAGDAQIFELSQGLVGGHALKHVAAAVSPLLILIRIKHKTRDQTGRPALAQPATQHLEARA